MSRTATAFAVGIVAALVGCTNPAAEALPLQITVETNRTTAAPGDTVTFTAAAQGVNLLTVEVSFGDGVTDSFATAGAPTVRAVFRHAFAARGTFTTTITATDASFTRKSASAQTTVQ